MIKTLIVSLSFFGMGVTFYLAVMNARNALYLRDKNEKLLEWSYAMARVGLVIVVGLIAELVVSSEGPVPLEWRPVLYVIGLGLILVGYLGIAVQGRRMKTLRDLREHPFKTNGKDS